MAMKTSEVIAQLQTMVYEHGDLPFVLWDDGFHDKHEAASVSVATKESCLEGEIPAIGIIFCSECEE